MNVPDTVEAILQKCIEQFSQGEITEVREFLDANEWGLALETLCGIVVEGHKAVSSDTYSAMVDAGHRMGLDQEKVEAVEQYVKNADR